MYQDRKLAGARQRGKLVFQAEKIEQSERFYTISIIKGLLSLMKEQKL